MKNKLLVHTVLLTVLILFSFACKKDFLDEKPNTDIIQPITLDDFEGLLNNFQVAYSPGLPTLSADEYSFISYPVYLSALSATERNAYIWAGDLFAGEIRGGDWSVPYQSIFYANNVITGLDKIKDVEKDKTRLSFLKGWALFNRAFAYYELVSNFSPAYDLNTSKSDLGVPLKLNPSVEDIQPRSSVQQTYDLILSDLQIAIPLLDSSLPSNRNRPSKISAYALLARIYLSMRLYDLAELETDNSLRLYDKLIDYNSVSQTDREPFNRTNDELIYWKTSVTTYTSISVFFNRYITMNPDMLAKYDSNDLRLNIYFSKQPNGSIIMKLTYNGFTSIYPFTGLATDELYLIKAECAARRNDLTTSLKFLNNLLIKRYEKKTFKEITASSSKEALDKILLERRKELIWRNIRWSDLKRLNKEGANIVLTRELNGKSYTLSPNDPKYVFPIPDNEIASSGIQQNQR